MLSTCPQAPREHSWAGTGTFPHVLEPGFAAGPALELQPLVISKLQMAGFSVVDAERRRLQAWKVPITGASDLLSLYYCELLMGRGRGLLWAPGWSEHRPRLDCTCGHSVAVQASSAAGAGGSGASRGASLGRGRWARPPSVPGWLTQGGENVGHSTSTPEDAGWVSLVFQRTGGR